MPLAKRMSRLGTESAFKILAKAKALEAAGRDIINLGIGAPDFRTPENIIAAGKKRLMMAIIFIPLLKVSLNCVKQLLMTFNIIAVFLSIKKM